jgi:hypothetical protein
MSWKRVDICFFHVTKNLLDLKKEKVHGALDTWINSVCVRGVKVGAVFSGRTGGRVRVIMCGWLPHIETAD